MTRARKTLSLIVLAIAALATLVYANRLLVLQYSLGWLTDIRHPREAYRPVTWMAGPPAADAPPAARPPNIIVIVADDMGYNDVSTHGGGYAAHGAGTPHIDSIARDGVIFEQGYAGAAVCTISRGRSRASERLRLRSPIWLRSSNGSRSGSISEGFCQGSESSGIRNPMGESPGTRSNLPTRNGQGPVCQ